MHVHTLFFGDLKSSALCARSNPAEGVWLVEHHGFVIRGVRRKRKTDERPSLESQEHKTGRPKDSPETQELGGDEDRRRIWEMNTQPAD